MMAYAEPLHAEAAPSEAPEPPVAEPTVPEPTAPEPTAPAPPPSTPAPVATPWGAPLRVSGKSRGLHWTTTAQVERTGDAPQLAIDVELHNTTRAPMKVSLHPPLASVMTTAAPGSSGEALGLGLGMRGEGMGSDVCSPGHGGPTTLRPDDRAEVRRKLVELDPLPWPAGQALRVTASASDCRPGRLVYEVIDVTIVQPASADGVPTLVVSEEVRTR